MKRFAMLAFLTTAPAACVSIERATLPEPLLLDRQWAQAAPEQTRMADHALWDAFLARYLSTDAQGVNRLDYGAVTAEDRARLTAYLGALQQVRPATLTRDQQLAFWINLYNAATVDTVLDAYPVDSILKITDGLLPTGPWDRAAVTVEGEVLSLNDIEHRIIRPVYKEARIHYALNCAATACPNLMPRAWRAERLEQDLAAAERAYVNDPRGVHIDGEGGLTLSKIYAWFREDFGQDEAAIIARIAQAARPDLRARLEGRNRVDRYAYDWSLNDTANASQE